MKILVVLDEKKYSKKIIKDVARLTGNTLADIIFLGVQQEAKAPSKHLMSVLLKHQQDLFSYFSEEDLPYTDFPTDAWQETSKGDWSVTTRGMKEFTLRIRAGSVAQQTLFVAKEMDCDLIILGCDGKQGCEWDGEMNVPLRIAEDSPCSVMVIKQTKKANHIVSILDKSVVSQEALEMVNQLATLHDIGLKIVGVQEQKVDKKSTLENRMIELLTYYNSRKISTWIKLIDSEDVKEYVTVSSREAIVALWMGGKQSLLHKLFSRSMVDKLLENTRSSLLILR